MKIETKTKEFIDEVTNKIKEEGFSPMHIMLAPEILEALDPYPRWEKRLIKRKYLQRKAVYLDVWVPYVHLFDFIPKYKWKTI